MSKAERIIDMLKKFVCVILSELWIERKNSALIEIQKRESEYPKISFILGNEKARNFLQAMVLCNFSFTLKKSEKEEIKKELGFDFFQALGGYRIIRADPYERQSVRDLIKWIISEPLPLSLVSDLRKKFGEFLKDFQEISNLILREFPELTTDFSKVKINIRKPMKIKRKHQPQLLADMIFHILTNYATDFDIFELRNILKRKYGLTENEVNEKLTEYVKSVSEILDAMNFFINEFIRFSDKEKQEFISLILEKLTCNKEGLLVLINNWKKVSKEFNVNPNIDWLEKIIMESSVDAPKWDELIKLSIKLSKNPEQIFEVLKNLERIDYRLMLDFKFPPRVIAMFFNAYGLLKCPVNVLHKDLQDRLVQEIEKNTFEIEEFLLLHLYENIPPQTKYLIASLILVKTAISAKFKLGDYKTLSKRALTLASEFVGQEMANELSNWLLSKVMSKM